MYIRDQLNNTFTLATFPKRIISLVPSQTELLYDLGLDDEIVGITKYCIHPKHWHKNKIKIGGTKKINLEKIDSLKPDLIIGNKEENEKSQIIELMKLYPVWMSDIKNMEDALNMIESIGQITKKENQALKFRNNIKKQFFDLKLSIQHNQQQSKRIAYFIWRRPYISVGEDTFIDYIIRSCGLENVFASRSRYPQVTPLEIQQANPSHIFLSSEPYPFQEKHIKEIQPICPAAKIILVDGEMFSWYGSRLRYTPTYLKRMLLNL
jgi:ABC-type Fe3+-hydroxamate transport system substrate-binding protein